MTDPATIAKGLRRADRKWIADWPEVSLQPDWWFTARDVGTSWQRMWPLRDLGLVVNRKRIGGRANAVHYQWTDLGRAVAAHLRNTETGGVEP